MKAFFLHLAYSLFYNVNKLLNIFFQPVTSKHFIQLLTYNNFVNKNSILVLEIASPRRTFLNAFYRAEMLYRGDILISYKKGRKKVYQ
jgi:hypothetical protein